MVEEVIREHNIHHANDDSGLSLLIGVIAVLAIAAFLFLYFGRGFVGQQPQINVPDRVNVDINQNP